MGEGRELIARAAEAVERIRTLGRADNSLLEPVLAAVLGETARNHFRAADLLKLRASKDEGDGAVTSLLGRQIPETRQCDELPRES
jgi:hypothetical protein